MNQRCQNGFTLIEVVLYVALLSILLTSALGVLYQLTRTHEADARRSRTQLEGDFVIRKIDWALLSTSSLSRIIAPLPGVRGERLSLIDAHGGRIDICRDDATIKMREGSDVSLPCGDASFDALTSTSVVGSELHFYRSSAPGTTDIEASTTLDGVVFSTSYTFRK